MPEDTDKINLVLKMVILSFVDLGSIQALLSIVMFGATEPNSTASAIQLWVALAYVAIIITSTIALIVCLVQYSMEEK